MKTFCRFNIHACALPAAGSVNRAECGPADQASSSLREMATIVDSAAETVSRVLGHVRRSDILAQRSVRGARFDAMHLRSYRLPADINHSG